MPSPPSHQASTGLRARFWRWLAHPRLPLHLALLAVLLASPSLRLGWHTDDHIHRAILTGRSWLSDSTRSVADLFVFVRSGEEVERELERGVLPWWTSRDLRLAFFRPLTAATHWLDYQLWPQRPELMHAQSLLWFGVAVGLAAVFFRRLLPVSAAGLGALAFAVDDAHGMPAAWLANRNALVALVFGLLALLAHHAWRQEGRRAGALLSPFFLALALLGGEAAIGAIAYLGAYALLLEKGGFRSRLLSLLPAGVVSVGWWVAYRALGYGAAGSAVYIDPGADPGAYLRAVGQRAPLLLFGQWGLPSDLHLVMSAPARSVYWWVACAWVAVVAVALLPLLRRERTARFLAGGMLLSLLPVCSTFASDRLLVFAGIGGSALLGLLLTGIWHRADWMPPGGLQRAGLQLLAGTLLVIHFVLAPIGLLRCYAPVESFGNLNLKAAHSLPSDPAVVSQRVVIVRSPSSFVSAFGPVIQALEGRRVPHRLLLLASGTRPIDVSRTDARTLLVRLEGGYLSPPGDTPALSMNHAFPTFDWLFRNRPIPVGYRVTLSDVEVEVVAVTEDGRPLEVRFRFAHPLEDAGYRWLRWRDGVYVPFDLPTEGETAHLDAISVPLDPQ